MTSKKPKMTIKKEKAWAVVWYGKWEGKPFTEILDTHNKKKTAEIHKGFWIAKAPDFKYKVMRVTITYTL